MVVKIAISMPEELYEQIEEARKELGMKRSEFIDLAVQEWIKKDKEKELIKQYIEGYKKYPETEEELAKIEAMQQDSWDVLEDEDWGYEEE